MANSVATAPLMDGPLLTELHSLRTGRAIVASSGIEMGLYRGRLGQNLSGRSASLSERLGQSDPDTFHRPTHASIVEDLLELQVSLGASVQRQPDFNTWTMPLMTRRSCTHTLFRVSECQCRAIFATARLFAEMIHRLLPYMPCLTFFQTALPLCFWTVIISPSY